MPDTLTKVGIVVVAVIALTGLALLIYFLVTGSSKCDPTSCGTEQWCDPSSGGCRTCGCPAYQTCDPAKGCVCDPKDASSCGKAGDKWCDRGTCEECACDKCDFSSGKCRGADPSCECYSYDYDSDRKAVSSTQRSCDASDDCPAGSSPAQYVGCRSNDGTSYQTQAGSIGSYQDCLARLRGLDTIKAPGTNADSALDQYPYIALNSCAGGDTESDVNCHCGVATAAAATTASVQERPRDAYDSAIQTCGLDVLYYQATDAAPLLVGGGKAANALYANPDYVPPAAS